MRGVHRNVSVCTLTVAAIIAAIAVLQCQETGPPRDTFRGGTDLVTLDVTVLDGDRRPIRGLTADDFVILDGGEPRPVEAFSAVELPSPPTASPSSLPFAAVAPDVAGNEPAEGRLVAILLDRSIPYGWPTFAARRIARAAVDALGPGDRAAVIHTGVGLPQEFTSDRRRLLAAIDAPSVGLTLAQPDPETLQPEFQTGECQCGVCTLDAMTHVALAVERAPERQKLLLFIGGGLPLAVASVDHGSDNCSVYVQSATHRMLQATQRAHLTVHAFDPNGLNPPADARAQAILLAHRILAGVPGSQAALQAPDALLALAAKTGGRAVLNSNEPEHELPAIFNETSAYYVVGFAPSPTGVPGAFRSVKISVRRSGARVRTRSGYYVPGGTPDVPATPADLLVDAVRDLLPHPGVRLQLDPLPFPSSTPGADISFVLRVNRSEDHTDAPVEILGAVYGANGHAVASDRHSVQPEGRTDAFEETFTLHVPSPGTYQVRVAALDDGRTGSVYTFADVPDFRRVPVSLSGVGIHLDGSRSETIGESTQTGRASSTVARLTIARAFRTTDYAAALAYVCQSIESAPKPVTASGTVFDTTGQSVLRRVDTLQPASFAASGCASYQVGLPLDHLGPGEYVLTIDVSLGASNDSRSVRFRVDE
jgi:VWFA-related protein